LVNVPIRQVRDDFAKGLDSFVRAGKGLLVTVGENVVPRDYNAVLGDLLPMPLAEAEPVPFRAQRDKPLTPDLASAASHSVRVRLGEGGNNPLRNLYEADTYAINRVDEPKFETNKHDAGRVLLRFNSRDPMLLSKSVGNGETMLLTAAVDPTSGYLFLNT